VIDLGGRRLEVLYTPGHASNHICLLDRDARYLYVGDNYYTGGISTYLPGGNHDDFIKSCHRMVEMLPYYDYLMPAHNQPLVEKEEILELKKAAEEIKAGTATNYIERMAIAADYNKPVRRYQYKRFSLTTDIEV
jgi:glyoxylase-like metal-dependent hydrolase (beta-lactamase superfamily II)